MSEAKFTKGEWIAEETDFDGEYEITTLDRIEDSKTCIVSIDTSYSGVIGKEQMANMHLIAAAPEMYEMLEDAMCLLAEQDDKECKSLSKDIRDLRKKARGEQ